MNICLFTSSFLPNVGGMENVVDFLAKEYIALGHQVVVLAKTPRKMKKAPDFDYPVYYYKRSRSEVFFLGAPKKMLKQLHKQYHFDLIHAHQMYPTGYLAVKFGIKHNIPAVLTSHAGDVRENSKYRRSWIKCRRMIWAMKQAPCVTGVGTGICETINQLTGKNKAIYLGNGCVKPEKVECTENLKSLFEKFQINGEFDLSVCRLHPNKGLNYLLNAYAILKSKNIPFPPLLMAGNGQAEESLRQQITEQNLSEHVYMLGNVTPAERDFLLSRCRFFMQPSIVEGMPLTVLESLAAGVPVLGTNIPGIRELLADKVNGLVVPPADPEALAEAIASITEENYLQYKSRAAEILEPNSWRKIAEQYLDLFEKLING